MKRTLQLFSLSIAALGTAAAAAPYTVHFADTVSVGGTQLKAGEYKVEMQGDKVVFKSGKKSFEVPATMAKGDHKFAATTLLSSDSKVKEIDLGGTMDRIVIGTAAPTSAGN